MSIVLGAEALVAGIVPANLGPSISQQDRADLRVAFPPKGGSRPNSRAHGHPEMGAMSPYGTNRTFADLWMNVRLPAHSVHSPPNVSFRAENRRFFRGR